MLLMLSVTGVYISSYAQQKDCRRFHDGTFTNINEETGATTLIERKGNMQTETTDGGKGKAVFYVKWTGDCICTLQPTKATRNRYPDWPKDASFTIEITETGEDGYQQVSTSNFTDTKITNEIKKVK